MTLAQSSESAQQSSGSVRVTVQRLDHNDPNEASNMSSPGPEEFPSLTSSPQTVLALEFPEVNVQDASTQTESQQPVDMPKDENAALPVPSLATTVKVLNRIYTVDLVQQLRHERYLENRVHSLEQRKKILRRTISLSARLHRVLFVNREGLTEISERQEPALPFKKVLQFTQDLVQDCYKRWNSELHALDPLEIPDLTPTEIRTNAAAKPRLSSDTQSELITLLNKLRNNSQYILQRIKSLSVAQLQGLSQTPSFRRHETTALGSISSRIRKPDQLRLQNFAHQLQEYSISLERANPWSFLLFNIYGSESSLQGPEHLLRLSTWSTVLADLYVTHEAGFHALAPFLLDSFASIQDWHAKEKIELHLMDVLQEGAFLLSSPINNTSATQTGAHPAHTPEARALFSKATTELLFRCSTSDGGFPAGAIQFISAVLGKLATEEQQMGFRGYCFSTWFVGCYLRQVMTYPETEGMLHCFHVSPAARRRILLPLWNRLNDAVNEVFQPNPAEPVDQLLVDSVLRIIGSMEAKVPASLYPLDDTNTVSTAEDTPVFICVAEIIRLLDTLSPQFQHMPSHDRTFLEASRLSFQAQYAQNPLSRLKNGLLSLQEFSTPTTETHPCDEQWMEFCVDGNGQLKDVSAANDLKIPPTTVADRDHDIVQNACLRLCSTSIAATLSFEGSTSYRADKLSKKPLRTLFQQMIQSPKVRIDSVSRMFWETAQRALSKVYPVCDLTGDDSTILKPLVLRSKELQSIHVANCARLEAEVGLLEDVLSKVKYATMTMIDQMEDLKMKLWYSTSVTTSKYYAIAKNISEALTNMALTSTIPVAAADASVASLTRPSTGYSMTSRSSTSSVFQQSTEATLVILKAKAEHGGPQKLSDEQILLTETWLREAVVENFCTGEERIHRFCMQVSSTAKAIISDSNDRSASPVLWSSVLFSNDDMLRTGTSNASSNLRAASVSSDPYTSSTVRPSRSIQQNNQFSRSMPRDEQLSPVRRSSVQGSFIHRFDREPTQVDSIFMVGSPGRAYSTTTTDSIADTCFSPQPSNSRSQTSASAYSRPPSVYEGGNARFSETWKEKSEKLDTLRHKLVCLLLSDLGNHVWSRGSETDAWLCRIREDADVTKRLEQWVAVEDLVGAQAGVSSRLNAGRPVIQRRESNPAPCSSHTQAGALSSMTPENQSADRSTINMALEELLIKMRSLVDPRKKLRAVEDFHKISVQQILRSRSRRPRSQDQADISSARRRNSVDVPESYPSNPRFHDPSDLSDPEFSPSETQIIHQLKINIKNFKPITLFRDLQYIAAFLPQELSNKTVGAEAVLRMGLAALAYKDDMCRSMVTVADKLLVKDSIKRPIYVDPIESTIKRASEFWMIAAQEGNAVAQRELGMMYLSHPHSIPIKTYPLWTASKVFQHDVQWAGHSEVTSNRTSLCLAFHWMKLAADNRDQVAEKELAERIAGISLR